MIIRLNIVCYMYHYLIGWLARIVQNSLYMDMTFILLINVKMLPIVGFFTFTSMINTTSEITSSFVSILVFMSS